MRTQRTLVALAILALATAGCGNDPAGISTSTSIDADPATGHAQAVAFAQCMRAHGVDAFPNPDALGGFRYAVEPGSSLDPRTVMWKQAIDACKGMWTPSGVAVMVAVDGGVVVLQTSGALDGGAENATDPGPLPSP